MEHVKVRPAEGWNFFQANREEMKKNLFDIASDDEFGVVIYMTEEDDQPMIYVYMDDSPEFWEECVSEHDCEQVLNRVYNRYLGNAVIETLFDKYHNPAASDAPLAGVVDPEDAIDEREYELDDAVEKLLEEFSDEFLCMSADSIQMIDEEIKDLICEHLWKKHQISVYRPMFLEDEHGTEFFCEYPYPQMIFDEK